MNSRSSDVAYLLPVAPHSYGLVAYLLPVAPHSYGLHSYGLVAYLYPWRHTAYLGYKILQVACKIYIQNINIRSVNNINDINLY